MNPVQKLIRQASFVPLAKSGRRITQQLLEDAREMANPPLTTEASGLETALFRKRVHETARRALYLLAMTRGADPEEARGLTKAIHRLASSVPDVDEGPGRLAQRWRQIRELAEKTVDPERTEPNTIAANLQSIHNELNEIVDDTWLKPWHSVPTYVVELVAKNRLLLLGTLSTVVVALSVPPIGSLFVDRWHATLPALLAVVAPPWLGFRFLVWLLRSLPGEKRRIPLQSSGIFWERRLRRPYGLQLDAQTAPRVFAFLNGLYARTAVMVSWTLAVCLGWWIFADSPIVTATWAFGLISVGLMALHVADFWSWVAPSRLRSLALAASAALPGYYLFNDQAWLKALAGLGALTLIALVYLLYGSCVVTKAKPAQALAWIRTRYLPPLVVLSAAFLALAFGRTHPDDQWSSELGAPPRRTVDATSWPRSGDGPVIVVAASGGGSRAAYFAARTYEMISAAGLDERVQLVSSVSGGSLATAAYVAQRTRREEHTPALTEVALRNYLQPVLEGALTPGTTRGQQLESQWTEVFGADITMANLARRWADGESLPLPIFNSATTDGHGFAITPLEWSVYNPSTVVSALRPKTNLYDRVGAEEATWVYYRTGIYGLETFGDGFDPHLAQAVRASANFPFGFPLVELVTTRGRVFSPNRVDRRPSREPSIIRLTDGGVVSNSGVWPLFHVLRNRAEALRDRGVVLVIVDASKMPEHSDLLSDLLGDQDLIGRNVHRRMIEILYDNLDGRLGIVQIDLPPLPSHNAYTSWALDMTSVGRLEADFDEHEQTWATQLTGLVTQLEDESARISPAPTLLPRVPLD